jgi:hypothetical protein
VIWELYVGESFYHEKVLNHHLVPLWESLGEVEQGLQELISTQHYLKNRAMRNRLSEFVPMARVRGWTGRPLAFPVPAKASGARAD